MIQAGTHYCVPDLRRGQTLELSFPSASDTHLQMDGRTDAQPVKSGGQRGSSAIKHTVWELRLLQSIIHLAALTGRNPQFHIAGEECDRACVWVSVCARTRKHAE